MKRLAILLVIVLVALVMTSALMEEEIVLYHSATDDQMSVVINAFNTQHPDIKVTTYRASGEEMGATVNMELMAENPQFDVLISGYDVFGPVIQRYAPFLEWEPENLDNIKPDLLDPTGMTYPIGAGFYVIIYNTNLLMPEDAPTSFLDLLDEKYMNQIVMADPVTSGSIYNFLWFVTQHLGNEEGYGWDYFTKMAKLNPMHVSSHGTLGEIVTLGERKIGIQVVSNAMTALERGDPIAVVFPEEGCPGDVNGVAIRKNSEHLEAAKVFANYLLSEEGQKVIAATAWPPILNKLDGFTFTDGTNPADIAVYKADKNWVTENKPEIIEMFRESSEKSD